MLLYYTEYKRKVTRNTVASLEKDVFWIFMIHTDKTFSTFFKATGLNSTSQKAFSVIGRFY